MKKIIIFITCCLTLSSSMAGYDEALALLDSNPVRAYKEFEVLAKEGHAKCQFYLAGMLFYGSNVEKDEAEGIKWAKKAIVGLKEESGNGDSDAECFLGLLYLEGLGIPKDVDESLRWLRAAAEHGNSEAQQVLGNAYHYGNLGVKKDEAESQKWFACYADGVKEKAEQGDALAQFELGGLYSSKRGVPKSDIKANEWYIKAAEQGSEKALLELGRLYQRERVGIDKDFSESMRWYRIAADQGSSEAKFEIGKMYQWGIGVDKNLEQAEAWYQKAAKTDARYQRELAEKYHFGGRYLRCDSANEYEKAEILRVDLEEAAKWYRKAAEQGDYDVQFRLGKMYQTGMGVPENYEEAFAWFKKAADQGDGEASRLVGWMYWWGDGVPNDDAQALKWYRKAAEQRDRRAREYLENLEASKIYVGAAESGDPDAQFRLGKSLCYGTFPFHKNVPKGAIWLYKSKDQGNEEAGEFLDIYERYKFPLTRDVEVNKRRVQSDEYYLKGLEYESTDLDKEFEWMLLEGEAGGYADDVRPFKFDPVARAKAAEWYLKAAKLGSPKAQEMLAQKYSKGEGVPKNMKESAKWYLEAAMQGDNTSQFALSEIYMEGLAVLEDYVEAYAWASVAAIDNPLTKFRKDWIKKSMTPPQLAEGQARAKEIKTEIDRRKEIAKLPISESSMITAIFPTAYGSGLLIKGGYVLTCWHVVGEAQRIAVSVAGKDYAAQVIRKDLANDIAVLQIDGVDNGTQIRLAGDPKLGEQVFTLGYPHPDLQGADVKFTMGTISGMTGPGETPNYYQVSAPVQSGNSGGPLFDQHGNLVGIVAAKLDSLATLALTGDLPQNVNYAIKADYLRPLLKTVSGLEIEPVNTKESNLLELIEELKKSAVLIKVY